MAAPTYYSVGFLKDATSGSTLGPVPYPSGIAAGQGALLVFWCVVGFTPQTPSGWTQVHLDVNAAGTMAVYERRLQGGDAQPSISVGASTFSLANSAGAVIIVYDGIVAAGQWWEAPTYTAATTTQLLSSEITTTGDDRLVAVLGGVSNDAAYPADWPTLPAAGWTLNAEPQIWNYSGDGTLLSVAKVQATAGTVASSAIGTYAAGLARWGTLTLALIPAPASTTDLEGYRWRNDDGNETAATWTANQDTGITASNTARRRLRTLIDATSGDPPSQPYRLQYRRQGDTLWEDLTT